MASSSSSSAHWGSSAVSFVRNVAQIVTSVAVAVVGIAAIYYVGDMFAPNLTQDVVQGLQNFWSDLPGYGQQGVDFFKGLWADLNGPGGAITHGIEFMRDQWNSNPWVKGGAAVAAVGVGAYAAGAVIDTASDWRSKVGGAQSSDNSHEMKELARRLRAAQAERGA